MESDIVIVGGGAVGLSTGLHLSKRTDHEVTLIEKEHFVGNHQSGRNSGVLHPGFNYEPGSLKAQFATEGTRRMKDYCRENNIPIKETGVVVSALDDEEENRLYDLRDQAEQNGAEARIIDEGELHEIEPAAAGQAALHAPEAASVDSQQYVYQLAKDAHEVGVNVFRGTELETVVDHSSGYTLETSGGEIETSFLINAAGLYADEIAHQVGVGTDYQVVPFRGEYFELDFDSRSMVNTMIYPTPDPELPFLGVHYTRRTDETVIIGPNAVLAFGREAYDNTDVDVTELADSLTYEGFWRLLASPKMATVAASELHKSYRKERFTAAAQRLVPDVTAADLKPSFAGIRAQMVSSDGTLVKEPVFVERSDAIHVLNAVSPGLTASLPFGDHLAERVEDLF